LGEELRRRILVSHPQKPDSGWRVGSYEQLLRQWIDEELVGFEKLKARRSLDPAFDRPSSPRDEQRKGESA